MAYDPNSDDAMFSRIIRELESISRHLQRIETHLVATDDRVSSLEASRTEQRVKTSLIALAVSAFGVVAGWWVQWKSK
jgi:GTPase